MLKRAEKQVKNGRCCWVCGRPGGEGFTASLALAGYDTGGKVAHAHAKCVREALKRRKAALAGRTKEGGA